MHSKYMLMTALNTTALHNKSLFHLTVETRCAFSSSSKNPYEVLGLKATCSMQDVKKAYIRLCKELHPDMKPGDDSQHKKFVELNNAYTSLINAQSRKQVDYKYSSSADNLQNVFHQNRQGSAFKPFNQESWQRDEAWYEREDYKNQFQHPKRDENIQKGFKKRFAVTFCFLLICVGSLLYFTAYRYASNYTLNIVNKKSKKISEDYQDVRKNALVSGREEQLEKLKKKWSL